MDQSSPPDEADPSKSLDLGEPFKRDKFRRSFDRASYKKLHRKNSTNVGSNHNVNDLKKLFEKSNNETFTPKKTHDVNINSPVKEKRNFVYRRQSFEEQTGASSTSARKDSNEFLHKKISENIEVEKKAESVVTKSCVPLKQQIDLPSTQSKIPIKKAQNKTSIDEVLQNNKEDSPSREHHINTTKSATTNITSIHNKNSIDEVLQNNKEDSPLREQHIKTTKSVTTNITDIRTFNENNATLATENKVTSIENKSDSNRKSVKSKSIINEDKKVEVSNTTIIKKAEVSSISKNEDYEDYQLKPKPLIEIKPLKNEDIAQRVSNIEKLQSSLRKSLFEDTPILARKSFTGAIEDSPSAQRKNSQEEHKTIQDNKNTSSTTRTLNQNEFCENCSVKTANQSSERKEVISTGSLKLGKEEIFANDYTSWSKDIKRVDGVENPVISPNTDDTELSCEKSVKENISLNKEQGNHLNSLEQPKKLIKENEDTSEVLRNHLISLEGPKKLIKENEDTCEVLRNPLNSLEEPKKLIKENDNTSEVLQNHLNSLEEPKKLFKENQDTSEVLQNPLNSLEEPKKLIKENKDTSKVLRNHLNSLEEPKKLIKENEDSSKVLRNHLAIEDDQLVLQKSFPIEDNLATPQKNSLVEGNQEVLQKQPSIGEDNQEFLQKNLLVEDNQVKNPSTEEVVIQKYVAVDDNREVLQTNSPVEANQVVLRNNAPIEEERPLTSEEKKNSSLSRKSSKGRKLSTDKRVSFSPEIEHFPIPAPRKSLPPKEVKVVTVEVKTVQKDSAASVLLPSEEKQKDVNSNYQSSEYQNKVAAEETNLKSTKEILKEPSARNYLVDSSSDLIESASNNDHSENILRKNPGRRFSEVTLNTPINEKEIEKIKSLPEDNSLRTLGRSHSEEPYSASRSSKESSKTYPAGILRKSLDETGRGALKYPKTRLSLVETTNSPSINSEDRNKSSEEISKTVYSILSKNNLENSQSKSLDYGNKPNPFQPRPKSWRGSLISKPKPKVKPKLKEVKRSEEFIEVEETEVRYILPRQASEDSLYKIQSALDLFVMDDKKEKKRTNSFKKIFKGFGKKDKDKDKDKKKPKKIENEIVGDNAQNESFNRNSKEVNVINKELPEIPCEETQKRYAQMHINRYNQVRANFEQTEDYVCMDNGSKYTYINTSEVNKYIDTSSSSNTLDSENLAFRDSDNSSGLEKFLETPPRAFDTYQNVQLVKPKANIPISSERPLPLPYQDISKNDLSDGVYGTVYDRKKSPDSERSLSSRSPSLEGSKLKLPANREKVELQPRIKSPIPPSEVSTDKIIATELLKGKKKDDKLTSPSHQRLEIEIDYPDAGLLPKGKPPVSPQNKTLQNLEAGEWHKRQREMHLSPSLEAMELQMKQMGRLSPSIVDWQKLKQMRDLDDWKKQRASPNIEDLQKRNSDDWQNKQRNSLEDWQRKHMERVEDWQKKHSSNEGNRMSPMDVDYQKSQRGSLSPIQMSPNRNENQKHRYVPMGAIQLSPIPNEQRKIQLSPIPNDQRKIQFSPNPEQKSPTLEEKQRKQNYSNNKNPAGYQPTSPQQQKIQGALNQLKTQKSKSIEVDGVCSDKQLNLSELEKNRENINYQNPLKNAEMERHVQYQKNFEIDNNVQVPDPLTTQRNYNPADYARTTSGKGLDSADSERSPKISSQQEEYKRKFGRTPGDSFLTRQNSDVSSMSQYQKSGDYQIKGDQRSFTSTSSTADYMSRIRDPNDVSNHQNDYEMYGQRNVAVNPMDTNQTVKNPGMDVADYQNRLRQQNRLMEQVEYQKQMNQNRAIDPVEYQKQINKNRGMDSVEYQKQINQNRAMDSVEYQKQINQNQVEYQRQLNQNITMDSIEYQKQLHQHNLIEWQRLHSKPPIERKLVQSPPVEQRFNDGANPDYQRTTPVEYQTQFQSADYSSQAILAEQQRRLQASEYLDRQSRANYASQVDQDKGVSSAPSSEVLYRKKVVTTEGNQQKLSPSLEVLYGSNQQKLSPSSEVLYESDQQKVSPSSEVLYRSNHQHRVGTSRGVYGSNQQQRVGTSEEVYGSHQRKISGSSEGMYGSKNPCTEGMYRSKNPSTEGMYGSKTPSTEGIYGSKTSSSEAMYGGKTPSQEGLYGGNQQKKIPSSEGIYVGKITPSAESLYGSNQAKRAPSSEGNYGGNQMTTNVQVHVDSHSPQNRSVTPVSRSTTPVNLRSPSHSSLLQRTPPKHEIRQSVEAFCWKELKKMKEQEDIQMQIQLSNYGYLEDPIVSHRSRSLAQDRARSSRRSSSLPREVQRQRRLEDAGVLGNKVREPIYGQRIVYPNPNPNPNPNANQNSNFTRNSPQRSTIGTTGVSNGQRPIFNRGSLTQNFNKDAQGLYYKRVGFHSPQNPENPQAWPTKNGYTQSPPQRRIELKKEAGLEDEVFLPEKTKEPVYGIKGNELTREEIFMINQQRQRQMHEIKEPIYSFRPLPNEAYRQNGQREPIYGSRPLNRNEIYGTRAMPNIREEGAYTQKANLQRNNSFTQRYDLPPTSEPIYGRNPNELYGRLGQKPSTVNNKVCDMYGKIHDNTPVQQTGVLYGQLQRNTNAPPTQYQSYNQLQKHNQNFVRGSRLTASVNDMNRYYHQPPDRPLPPIPNDKKTRRSNNSDNESTAGEVQRIFQKNRIAGK